MPAALLLVTAASGVQAQNTLVSQRRSGDLVFYVDIASYKNIADPSRTFVEIYYAMNRGQMTFINLPSDPSILSAFWQIQTVVETEVGDRVTWNVWQVASQDSSRSGAQSTLDTYDTYPPPLLLEPGIYKFITTLTDLNSQLSGDTKIGVDERLVIIPDYRAAEMTISDIQFAVRLGRASSPNKFVKSGLQVIPNPLRVYGVNVPMLSFYSEVYGLTPPGEGAEPPTLTRVVTVDGLNVDYRRELDRTTRPVRSSSEIIALSNINVGVMPRGDYRLILEVIDDRTGRRSIREKQFQIITEHSTIAEDSFRFIEMNAINAQRFREEIEPLASPAQLEQYDRADQDGKREFLIAFWEHLDPDPASPGNAFRDDYMQRFRYANENFASRTEPEGRKTDQGRVWIKYGRPDDIVPHPDDTRGGRAWVEWIYNQLPGVGRARFIFVDDSGGLGTGYRLLHSNVPGEIQNPDWQRVIGITDPTIPPIPPLR